MDKIPGGGLGDSGEGQIRQAHRQDGRKQCVEQLLVSTQDGKIGDRTFQLGCFGEASIQLSRGLAEAMAVLSLLLSPEFAQIVEREDGLHLRRFDEGWHGSSKFKHIEGFGARTDSSFHFLRVSGRRVLHRSVGV